MQLQPNLEMMEKISLIAMARHGTKKLLHNISVRGAIKLHPFGTRAEGVQF